MLYNMFAGSKENSYSVLGWCCRVLVTIVQHTLYHAWRGPVSSTLAFSLQCQEHIRSVENIAAYFQIPKEAEVPVFVTDDIIGTECELRCPVAMDLESWHRSPVSR
jgi:hypothetical protein